MGDRWNSSNVGSLKYVWLPLSMRSGYPRVKWYDSWDLSIFKHMYRYKRAKNIEPENTYVLLEKCSDRIVSKTQNGFSISDDNDEINLQISLETTDETDVYKIKTIKTGQYLESVYGSLRLSNDDTTMAQKWIFTQQDDGYYSISNQKDSKAITVSGSSTKNGTFLYLAKLDKDLHQEFAIYFDSYVYDYEVAEIFPTDTGYILSDNALLESLSLSKGT
jgi:hypothetical protein